MCDWEVDSDLIVDKMIRDQDDTVMPMPSMDTEPHLLISKVRKHYMEYIIKLLSVNYENHQKLLNKNIYLPSAIWRCAKNIEAKAAQTCMVVQLYRKSITEVIAELRKDTKKGKLNRQLYECLHRSPENEKNLQTCLNTKSDCNCQCTCSLKKKRRLLNKSTPLALQSLGRVPDENMNGCKEINKIPVLINSEVKYHNGLDELTQTPNEIIQNKNSIEKNITENVKPNEITQNEIFVENNITENVRCVPEYENEFTKNNTPQPQSIRMSIESQDSDELMMQLEKLFKKDSNDDDLFDGDFGDIASDSSSTFFVNNSKHGGHDTNEISSMLHQGVVHECQSKKQSLDERLASLAEILVTEQPDPPKQITEPTKAKRFSPTKWLCEEHFLKTKFFEMLDEIGHSNRSKLMRVKEALFDIFGADSDDEHTVISPLEETPDFVLSCKERIAPIVVKLLTPYYMKGRIRGRNLFKSLAKHLIKLIYQCSYYPREHEVVDFVTDFLENHKLIRCEADFKQFRIDNI